MPVNSSTGAVWLTLTNVGILQNGWGNPDLVSTNLSRAFVSATPQTLAYDPDGNLTNDGRFTYTWDQENRLVRMVSLTNTPTESKRTVTADYDWLGRRIRLGVSILTNSAWRVVLSNKFVYDGWSLAAELNATNNAVLRTYAWGLDLSGTMQGVGGVGGLLWVNDRTALGTNSSHFVAYDGNGNVSALVDAGSGNETARYEYGPFGDLIRATGPMALANPIRFSSKYHDDTTGLIYYGYRYYSPGLQRWLNRDPLGEEGGLNLYGFVGNDPISLFDVNGEYTFGEWMSIAGGAGEGLGMGALNVGKAGWGLVKSPYTITKALSETAGNLSTDYGWQQLGQKLYLANMMADRFRRDECFRDRVLTKFGEEAKDYFTDPYKLSELFAEIGVAAGTAGLGAWAESAQGAEKLAKLAKLLEEFSPGTTKGLRSIGAGDIARNALPLTQNQIDDAVAYAQRLGIPEAKIRVYPTGTTGYSDLADYLRIAPDVLPGPGAGANSRVTLRGAIAHEIIGHRQAGLAERAFAASSVLDEVQASARAARLAPELTSLERYILRRDAVERLQRAGMRWRNVRNQIYFGD